MKDFTRPDEGMALAVDKAIEMESSSGCILAWQYLHMHAVPPGVAMRVLSQIGPRRASSSSIQGVPEKLAEQVVLAVSKLRKERQN